MLCAHGAVSGTRAGIRRAIFAYDHSWSYVAGVLAWASRCTVPVPASAAASAIAFAIRQVGKPYQWGAGPYDCSGLVFAAYAAASVHIGRTTYQWRQDGPRVPLAQIQPGDLLFSAGSDGTPANPGHVVMYLGGGQIIQAPQTGEDVQIDSGVGELARQAVAHLARLASHFPSHHFPRRPDTPGTADVARPPEHLGVLPGTVVPNTSRTRRPSKLAGRAALCQSVPAGSEQCGPISWTRYGQTIKKA